MPGLCTAELVNNLFLFAAGNNTRIPAIMLDDPIDNLYVKIPDPGITSYCCLSEKYGFG